MAGPVVNRSEPRGAVTAYLGLGSNLGDRVAHLRYALGRLAEHYELTGVSSVWETDPVGYEDQPRFLNLVARIVASTGPDELLRTVRRIEGERGRERTFPNAPRTLDIDVLLYGREVVQRADLEVPHPRMAGRPFVLTPLLELDPELEDPRTGERFADLEAALPSHTEMDRRMAGEELLDEDQA